MRSAADGAEALRTALLAEGGALAETLAEALEAETASARSDRARSGLVRSDSARPDPAQCDPTRSGPVRPDSAQCDPTRPGPAQVAAAGPRASGLEAEYELLVEMILEGSRLHYGRPAVVAASDPDLALLLGDQLYALGLARLAVIGDLAAITELADVISLVAQAHAHSDPALADAVWDAGAVAIGWGASAAHDAAKALARAGDPQAAAALRSVALAVRDRR